jgi:c-di-GMP-binding flagellar brake protein YcgR
MEIFDQAVREHALVVVTVQEGDDWVTLKSRFLERDSSHHYFVLDYQAPDGGALPSLVPGQYVGISFRHKSRKIMFATVVEAKGKYVLDDKTTVAAVRYRWPQTMTELQRRAYFRTPVPASMTLLANLWLGGAAARAAAQNRTREIVTGQIVDLSCGGCLIRLGNGQPPAWEDNLTLGLELQLGDGRPPIVLNANARGVRQDAQGTFCVAAQFVGLEVTMDGRVVLQRLAASVQRFHRLAPTPDFSSGQASWGF